jgi:hypothetical protein
MIRDIDQLTAALRRAYPEITIETRRVNQLADDVTDDVDGEERWFIRHPSALVDVQIETRSGDVPFVVESDLAPPTVARTVDRAVRLVTERLGLRIGRG